MQRLHYRARMPHMHVVLRMFETSHMYDITSSHHMEKTDAGLVASESEK